MSNKTQKVYTSRQNILDANTYVGEAGRLFYSETGIVGQAPVLKYSDGVTPGGLPMAQSSQQTNFGNIVAGNVAVSGDYYYSNGASLTSTIQNFVATVDFGNLYIVDETIYGKNTNQDIYISPAGTTGNVVVPRLKIPVGSIISNSSPISVIVLNTAVESVLTYSTNLTDALPTGTYGIPNGVAAPYTVYKLTSNASPNIIQNDHVSGIDLPLGDVVQIGTGYANGNANVIVVNKSIDGQPVSPGSGTVVFATRDIVNSGFTVATVANTDISLAPGVGGSTITTANLLPFIDNVTDLGSPTRRFHHLWMGTGTIYVQDETLGSDLAIGARGGNLYVAGGVGLTVGKFTIFGNTIALTTPAEDFYIGSQYATGNLNIRRPLQVLNSSGNVEFAVTRTGRVQINSGYIPTSTPSVPEPGAVLVNGSIGGTFPPVSNPGGMLHIVGTESNVSRITLDSVGTFSGSGAYTVFTGRAARGTYVTPTATQAGDTFLRISGVGYGATGYPVGGTTIELAAAQSFTDSAAGTQINFYTTPLNNTGSTAKTLSAVITPYGITLPNVATVGTGTGAFTGNGGITFADNTRQVTAWVPANNIQQIAVGTGFTPSEQGTHTGNISLNTVDVHSVESASYSLTVANITPNSQTLRLTLAQEIGTNSSPTFSNVYVGGNLYVAGNVISQGSAAIQGKILYLANNSSTSADINGGGIQLGANLAAYSRAIKYSLTGAHGDYWYTDTDTGFQTEHLVATDAYLSSNLFSNGTARFGGAYSGYDFPNAGVQVFENVNSYAQIVEQNLSTGTQATTDYIATANNGDDYNHYIDLGIAGSNYDNTNANNSLGTSLQRNDAYLYAQGNVVTGQQGGNLVIGTNTFGRVIRFIAGGNSAANIAATISNTGLVVAANITATNITATANVAAQYYLGSARYMSDLPVQLQSDWNQSTVGNVAYIKNKPDLSVYATVTQLNDNVVTINSSITSLTSNAAYQAGQINNITANIGGFYNYANVTYSTVANAAFQNTWLSNLQANVGTLTSNATFQNTWLSNLQSNITTINNSITNISGNAALTFVTNAAQNIGNAKNTLLSLFGLANGVALTTNTRYQYEIVFNANCSKAGAMSYALANTATIAQHNYTVQSNKTTTVDGYTAGITMMSFNATGSSITVGNPIADTSTFTHTEIYGTIDVVTGGTVNFMVSQDQNTPVTWYVLPGAFIRLFPLGPIGANTVIGTWT